MLCLGVSFGQEPKAWSEWVVLLWNHAQRLFLSKGSLLNRSLLAFICNNKLELISAAWAKRLKDTVHQVQIAKICQRCNIGTSPESKSADVHSYIGHYKDALSSKSHILLVIQIRLVWSRQAAFKTSIIWCYGKCRKKYYKFGRFALLLALCPAFARSMVWKSNFYTRCTSRILSTMLLLSTLL